MKIVIKSIDRPKGDVDAILDWFCETFGLANDSEHKIEGTVLKKLLLAARQEKGLSSKELAEGETVAHSTIIYHLNRFMDSGLIVKKGRKYYLRAPELSVLVEEMEYDVEKEFRRISDIVAELDSSLPKLRLQKRKKA